MVDNPVWPLIRVWTMRMESKHSLFMRCARSSQNFVNITKTLSETHQLNQAYLHSGFLMCDSVKLGSDCTVFDEVLFAPSLDAAVKHLTSPVRCAATVTVKGTKYSKNALL